MTVLHRIAHFRNWRDEVPRIAALRAQREVLPEEVEIAVPGSGKRAVSEHDLVPGDGRIEGVLDVREVTRPEERCRTRESQGRG
jgi:hypothetical protein